MYKKLLFIILIKLLATTFLYSADVVPGSENILQKLQERFIAHLSVWIEILKRFALRLFFLLASINLLIKIIILLIEGADFQKTVATVTKFIFVTAVFYYFLDQGVILAQKIINSFIQLGESTTGTSVKIENILTLGWTIINSVISNISFSFGSFGIAIGTLILGLATFVVLLLIVANYIVEVLSAWMMVYMGYFVLAFGGMDFTREAAISYIKAIIGAGMRIMTVTFMVALALDNIQLMTGNSYKIPVTPADMIYCFTTTLLLLLLIQKIPDAVSALVSNAWGHMSAVNMATAVAAGGVAFKAGKFLSNVSGATNIVSGIKEGIKEGYNAQKNKGQDIIPNNASGSDKSGQPLFNKLGSKLGKPVGNALGGIRNSTLGVVKANSPFNNSSNMSKTDANSDSGSSSSSDTKSDTKKEQKDTKDK